MDRRQHADANSAAHRLGSLYPVSLIALFCVPAVLYHFLREFSEQRAPREDSGWLLTLAAAAPSLPGRPPCKAHPEKLPYGGRVFPLPCGLAGGDPHGAVPGGGGAGGALCAGSEGPRACRWWWPAWWCCWWGTCQRAAGQHFPFDTMAGIINAALVFWALYRRGMLQLRVFVAPGAVSVMAAVLAGLMAMPAVRRALPLLRRMLGDRYARVLWHVYWCLAVITALLVYHLLRWMVQRQFVLEASGSAALLCSGSAWRRRTICRGGAAGCAAAEVEKIYGKCPACVFLPHERRQEFLPVSPENLERSAAHRRRGSLRHLVRRAGGLRARLAGRGGQEIAPDKLG